MFLFRFFLPPSLLTWVMGSQAISTWWLMSWTYQLFGGGSWGVKISGISLRWQHKVCHPTFGSSCFNADYGWNERTWSQGSDRLENVGRPSASVARVVLQNCGEWGTRPLGSDVEAETHQQPICFTCSSGVCFLRECLMGLWAGHNHEFVEILLR